MLTLPHLQAEALLLTVTPDGSTALHSLAIGEPLGLGGGMLWAAARLSLAGDVWPSRHQRARAHLLSALLQRCPRLALLAAHRNASGDTPLHCAVLTSRWGGRGAGLHTRRGFVARLQLPVQLQLLLNYCCISRTKIRTS